ncbi:hypothetical protein [Streptomyces sp. NPDC019890]|uniref:hypothetical protein n=1 Tax=Streptomyces sp. NPDC019890 TaxID=3365064 RepID=UPI003851176C
MTSGEDLTFISQKGTLRSAFARFGPDLPRLVSPPAMARAVQLGDEWKGLQVRLPSSNAKDHTAYGLLETEISTALTLQRAYGTTSFRSLFPVLVGYDMHAEEPYAIYAGPRGRPISSHTQGVSTGEQLTIERDLVLAVGLMEAVGLVHRGIMPAAVRWDGQRIQLWNLGSSTRARRPRDPWGVSPFASPEQRAGTGETDPRDALWSVGQVMHQLVTGRPGSPDGPTALLSSHRSLEQTLGGVFRPRATDRPTVDELLELLHPGTQVRSLAPGVTDGLEPHRREFDEAMRRKHAALPGPTAPPPDPYSAVPMEYLPDISPAAPVALEYEPRTPRKQRRHWFVGGSTSTRDTDSREGGQHR